MKERGSGKSPNQDLTSQSKANTKEQGSVHKESAANMFGALMMEKQSWGERPHEELVGILRSAVARACAEYKKEKKMGFDPVVWLGDRLTQHRLAASPYTGSRANPPILDLANAWEAISEPYIKSRFDRFVARNILEMEAEIYSCNVTLEPDAVKVLDAMAATVGIPRTRGEAAVDLLKNIRPSSDNNPTVEEKSEKVTLPKLPPAVHKDPIVSALMPSVKEVEERLTEGRITKEEAQRLKEEAQQRKQFFIDNERILNMLQAGRITKEEALPLFKKMRNEVFIKQDRN